jgi:hypothetical protein
MLFSLEAFRKLKKTHGPLKCLVTPGWEPLYLINTDALLEASKDVGLDINKNESEYMCILVILPKTGRNCHVISS